MSDGQRVRAFLAVPPDPAWSESAKALLSRLRPSLPDASWTRPESWHLTLRFLGEVSRERLAEFASRIGTAAARRAPSRLAPGGPVVFPPRGPARVLGAAFAEDSGAAALAALASDAEECARAIRLEPERRPFRPHVTLARIRRPWPPDAVARFRDGLGGWSFPSWPVGACVLYESRLAPEGATHTTLGRWTLPAAEGRTA
jgi:2'-5' RNA ligase